MTQWRVEINNTEFANNLYDVEVTDALNRFGRTGAEQTRLRSKHIVLTTFCAGIKTSGIYRGKPSRKPFGN